MKVCHTHGELLGQSLHRMAKTGVALAGPGSDSCDHIRGMAHHRPDSHLRSKLPFKLASNADLPAMLNTCTCAQSVIRHMHALSHVHRLSWIHCTGRTRSGLDCCCFTVQLIARVFTCDCCDPSTSAPLEVVVFQISRLHAPCRLMACTPACNILSNFFCMDLFSPDSMIQMP